MRSSTLNLFPTVVCAFLISAMVPDATRGQQTAVVDFFGPNLISAGVQEGDLTLSRASERARKNTRTVFTFGPASPKDGYSGPAFSLGYELKSSEPSDLWVPEDQLMIEDDFKLPNGKKADTLSISFTGDWPKTTSYSIAAVVVFPTREFALQSLAYAANNWGGKTAKSYNDKLRHRWLVMTGGKYYVNTGFLARTAVSETDGFNVIRSERGSSLNDRWVPYDPQRSLFAQLDGPSVALGDALEHVTAVGFYMDCVNFSGAGEKVRQWQLKLIQFTATGYPADER